VAAPSGASGTDNGAGGNDRQARRSTVPNVAAKSGFARRASDYAIKNAEGFRANQGCADWVWEANRSVAPRTARAEHVDYGRAVDPDGLGGRQPVTDARGRWPCRRSALRPPDLIDTPPRSR